MRCASLPTAAVVIPCYNQGHFVGDAIRSVLAQTHPAQDIVVVNDGSTDDTSAVVERFAGVRQVAQVNAGLSSARNRGIEGSTGELLVFLDADDRLLPNALEVGAAFMASHPDHAFTWGFNVPIDRDGQVVGGISNPHTGPSTFERLLERNIVGPPVGVMFRRGPLEVEGGFSTDLNAVEDWDMYARLAHTRSFESHGQTVAEYRYHSHKMSDDFERMHASAMQLAARFDSLVGSDPRLRAAVDRGRRHATLQFRAGPLWESLAEQVREGRWGRATAEAAVLASRYPGFFFSRIRRRVWRGLGSAAD